MIIVNFRTLSICQILPDADRRTWRSREGVWLPPENI